MSEEINLEQTLLETIEKADIRDEIFDLADKGFNQFIKSKSILEEIPFVRSLFAIGRSTMAIRDFLLIKKLIHFLKAINTISDDDKTEIWWDLEYDYDKRKVIGEHLLTLLDRVESTEKADYLGRLMKAYILKKIKYSELLRLTLIVTNLFTEDLKALPIFHKEQRSIFYSRSLHTMGLLVKTATCDNRGNDVEDDGYEISLLGKKLVDALELTYPSL
ncbi:hypothetical protein [Sediminibacterium goheungense]|uniref:Uncharacterized protein n=1 Tax=Sediminibacterium goheungense TaxID=1086393 RepID=A0A4R6IUG7_9BACT|nr:hypothetical protein [Sediminibacterium goheungense]TDO26249.1 hypothetical protein BC659_1554 [Sediminibacterium goheungense]